MREWIHHHHRQCPPKSDRKIWLLGGKPPFALSPYKDSVVTETEARRRCNALRAIAAFVHICNSSVILYLVRDVFGDRH